MGAACTTGPARRPAKGGEEGARLADEGEGSSEEEEGGHGREAKQEERPPPPCPAAPRAAAPAGAPDGGGAPRPPRALVLPLGPHGALPGAPVALGLLGPGSPQGAAPVRLLALPSPSARAAAAPAAPSPSAGGAAPVRLALAAPGPPHAVLLPAASRPGASPTAAPASAPSPAAAPAAREQARAPWPAAAPAAREQESDLLERYPKGQNCLDEEANAIPLVSLGCYCGPKLSFQKMGRGAATLPFDWIRTTVDGLLHYIRSDFSGFFDFVTKLPVPGCNRMVMYRDRLHSFWHDDPEDPAMREKYARRIERFNQLDARVRPVLFVRSAAATEELLRAAELVEVLVARFGKEARLLLILNFQDATAGPAFVKGVPNLMVYYLTPEVHRKTSPEFDKPFAGPVLAALDWALGRELEAASFESLPAALAAADVDVSGYNGLGGLSAFEGGKAGGGDVRPEVRGAGQGVRVVQGPPVMAPSVRAPTAIVLNSVHAAAG